MAVQWGRRLLTGLVGIPSALWLLSWPLGMLLLASALCSLCLVEFSGSISPGIVNSALLEKAKSDEKEENLNFKKPAISRAHQVALVALGVAACAAASTGRKEVHGECGVGI